MRATIGLAIQSRYYRWILEDARRPWVARIPGLDPRFDLDRRFQRSKVDYSEADKKGRGIKHWFVLRPGVYEIYEPLPRLQERRYFARVQEDGTILEIPKEVAMADLQYVFEPIDAKTVWKMFGVRAKLEGVNVYPTGKTPVDWRCLKSGEDIVAVYGLMHGKTRRRRKGIYVRPDCRGKGIGTATIRDSMELAREGGYDLEALVYNPKPHIAAGWTLHGDPKPTKFGPVQTVRWSPKDGQT